MKCRKNYNLAIAVAAQWLSTVAIPAKAVQYGCAAERDERRGLQYTAAMQWRKAAELFPPDTRAAEYFWRQWERVMQLPRRLAGPIEDRPSPAPLELVHSAPQRLVVESPDEVSLPIAA